MSCRVVSSPVLSSYELARATDYLASTRDGVIDALSGVSDSQWHFRPAAERWSVAEILEHLVVIEDRVHGVVGRMQDAPPAEPGRVNSEVEEIIFIEVPKRVIRIEAPPHLLPTGRWSPVETIARFHQVRSRTLELLVAAPYLRGHVAPHPILGAWDGYQWILAAAAHSARHTDQILEVKACPGFPATSID